MSRRATPDSFWARVTRGDGCWTWDGAHFRSGYARVKWQGRDTVAHLIAYELATGPVPEGLDVVVEVLNSTPEPDGSVKTYHLRVHPAFGEDRAEVTVPLITLGDDGRELRRRTVTVPRTPHAAIASTFGLTPDEYRPAVMT